MCHQCIWIPSLVIVKSKQLLFNETRMKSSQLKQNLETKRKLRYSYTQQLVKNELKEDLRDQLTKDVHFICVIGEKGNSRQQSEKPISVRLQLQKVWQKVHNEKWIIGVNVVNKGKIPIVNMQLLLKFKDGRSLTCKTYFYIRKKLEGVIEKESYRNLIAEWQSPKILHTDVSMTGIAVLNLPSDWHDRNLIACGVLTYHMEKETSEQVHQLQFPDVEIRLEEFVKGELSPFQSGSSACEEDFLSVLVCSYHLELLTSESVVDVLKGNLGFSSLSECGRYYCNSSATPYLAGILVEAWHGLDNSYHLTIYAKDSSQALRLVQCIYSGLSYGARILPMVIRKTPDVQKMYKSLEAEINFTSEHLIKWEERYDSVEGKIRVPKKEYYQFRSLLFNLERETDELHIQAQ